MTTELSFEEKIYNAGSERPIVSRKILLYSKPSTLEVIRAIQRAEFGLVECTVEGEYDADPYGGFGDYYLVVSGYKYAPTSFTCPRCGAVSHHPKDVEHKYCAKCHDWTG